MSAVLKDDTLRLGLDKKCLQGQCYYGCNTVIGKVSWEAQVTKQDINHCALTIHWFCHLLSLACNDTIKKSTLIRNSLETAF